ncbi:hypothetical protein CEXT_187271 [Caerostris extrusa]|uniref:Uncharacterized protein n=1 Tax=Caerostris extrusa TaxID=172846 RepID=A0AAV4VU49_CAEEX|nr:hypothetical protein CEXT_187271 [Caerostris extrusa]
MGYLVCRENSPAMRKVGQISLIIESVANLGGWLDILAGFGIRKCCIKASCRYRPTHPEIIIKEKKSSSLPVFQPSLIGLISMASLTYLSWLFPGSTSVVYRKSDQPPGRVCREEWCNKEFVQRPQGRGKGWMTLLLFSNWSIPWSGTEDLSVGDDVFW